MIRTSAAWFREVSGGRYSVSGAVTPWLPGPPPVELPQRCQQRQETRRSRPPSDGASGSRSFQRFILVMPCDAGGILGYAALPGSTVVLFDLSRIVVVHEQGHNLGLQHASSRQCFRGTRPVTWSRRCRLSEYGDAIDAMGNYRAGHYNAFYKARLGWPEQPSNRDQVPDRPARPGREAGSWVQGDPAARRQGYVLARVPDPDRGRRQHARGHPGSPDPPAERTACTQVLDAAPRSRIGVHPFEDADLAEGDAWTTPQGVRITVAAQSRTSAMVRIRFR